MGVEEEDRISKLPDELLGQILSCLESPEAVQTSILSKRWVYLWTTLPCLNFEQIPYSNYGMSHYCSNFVTNFLKNRNQHSVITTFKVDCNGEYTKILDYALAHNVENLHICNDHRGGYTCLNSAFIKTLHLTLSAKVDPMVWTLPNLTSLYLEHVKFGNRISGFDNLKELTLAGSFEIFYAQEIFTINCPNLESLILGPDFSHCTFVVSAPKLLYFEFRSSHVPDFSAGDGFPCVKEVDIDIEIEGFDWRFYDEDRIKLTMQNFIKMLNAVRATPLLKLSWETIQVLQRIPDFSEYQPSPFGNIKFLCLRGLQENPTTPNHLVTDYLLRNSPCAEILKGHLGRNPQLQNKSRGW